MTLVRTAVWALLAITVALAALIAAPRPAHGCSCSPDRTLSDYIDDADVIFAGRSLQRIGPDDPSYHSALSRSEGMTIIFEVERVFKGRAGPLLAARTAYGVGDCGYKAADKSAAAVLATRRGEHGWWVSEPGDLEVGLCGSRYTVNELEETLGPGYPPDETMVEVAELLENSDKLSTGTYLLIWGVAAVLVGGAIFAFRWRRR